MKTKNASDRLFGSGMYKTVCSECGQECEVLFSPDEIRPICRACFLLKHKN